MGWVPASFDIAMPSGPVSKAGRTYRGLGLFRAVPASPKGRRPPRWSLTHLGTGHSVAFIDAQDQQALAIATEIAEAGDWAFDTLQGYRNQFPDASEKVGAILLRHAGRAFRRGGSSNEEVARAVAEARF